MWGFCRDIVVSGPLLLHTKACLFTEDSLTHKDQVSAAFYSAGLHLKPASQVITWCFLNQGKVIWSIYTNPGGRRYRCTRSHSEKLLDHFTNQVLDWLSSFQADDGFSSFLWYSITTCSLFSFDKAALFSRDEAADCSEHALCCFQGHWLPKCVIWLLRGLSYVDRKSNQRKQTCMKLCCVQDVCNVDPCKDTDVCCSVVRLSPEEKYLNKF